MAATPRGEKPFSGSSQAGVRTASPEAMARNHRSFCAGLPAAASTPPLMTALTKWGVGARARPSSSYSATPSMSDMPEPPYSSGSSKPIRSSAPSWDQRGAGYPTGVVLHGSHHLERTVLGQHVAHGLAQQLLLLVEFKVEHSRPLS